jgi:hypothetical protein
MVRLTLLSTEEEIDRRHGDDWRWLTTTIAAVTLLKREATLSVSRARPTPIDWTPSDRTKIGWKAGSLQNHFSSICRIFQSAPNCFVFIELTGTGAFRRFVLPAAICRVSRRLWCPRRLGIHQDRKPETEPPTWLLQAGDAQATNLITHHLACGS